MSPSLPLGQTVIATSNPSSWWNPTYFTLQLNKAEKFDCCGYCHCVSKPLYFLNFLPSLFPVLVTSTQGDQVIWKICSYQKHWSEPKQGNHSLDEIVKLLHSMRHLNDITLPSLWFPSKRFFSKCQTQIKFEVPFRNVPYWLRFPEDLLPTLNKLGDLTRLCF